VRHRVEGERRHGLRHALGVGASAGLLGLVLLVAALTIVVPAATGSRAFSVLSGSMEPAYPIGTLVIVKPADPAQIRIGEVLTYQSESGQAVFVTHRVVARASESDGTMSFTTQGDANTAADAEPVLAAQVVGTVWYAVPFLGYVNTAVNGDLRPVVIPAVAGVLFAYATWMFVSGGLERRRRRRRVLARNQVVTGPP
jgi:signal peptidase